jgi:hypothetical protein
MHKPELYFLLLNILLALLPELHMTLYNSIYLIFLEIKEENLYVETLKTITNAHVYNPSLKKDIAFPILVKDGVQG